MSRDASYWTLSKDDQISPTEVKIQAPTIGKKKPKNDTLITSDKTRTKLRQSLKKELESVENPFNLSPKQVDLVEDIAKRKKKYGSTLKAVRALKNAKYRYLEEGLHLKGYVFARGEDIVWDEKNKLFTLIWDNIPRFDWKFCLEPETLHLVLKADPKFLEMPIAQLRSSFPMSDQLLHLKHNFWNMYDRWVAGTVYGKGDPNRVERPGGEGAPTEFDVCRGVCDAEYFRAFCKQPNILVWFFRRETAFSQSVDALQSLLLRDFYSIAAVPSVYEVGGKQYVDSNLAKLKVSLGRYCNDIKVSTEVHHKHLHLSVKEQEEKVKDKEVKKLVKGKEVVPELSTDPVIGGVNISDVDVMDGVVKTLSVENKRIAKLLGSKEGVKSEGKG